MSYVKLSPGVRFWFTEGVNAIKNKKIPLPLDIYKHITSYVLTLPLNEANTLLLFANERHRDRMMNSAKFFSTQRDKKAKDNAIERYEWLNNATVKK